MGTLTEIQKQKLIVGLGRIRLLDTVGIGFVGQNSCEVIKPASMPNGLQTWIMLQEMASNPEPHLSMGTQTLRGSNLGTEMAKMGLSCISAGLTGFVAATGAAAAPLTAGASTIITWTAGAASVASAAQCGIGIGRVFNEIFAPENNAYLDSEKSITYTTTALDVISVAGGVAGLGQAAQAAIRLSRTSGRPLSLIIRSMTRAERKRIAEDLARYAGTAPTRKVFLRLAREGKLPKMFSQASLTKGIQDEMLNVISAALDIGSSAYFKDGAIHQVAVYFVEEGEK